MRLQLLVPGFSRWGLGRVSVLCVLMYKGVNVYLGVIVSQEPAVGLLLYRWNTVWYVDRYLHGCMYICVYIYIFFWFCLMNFG